MLILGLLLLSLVLVAFIMRGAPKPPGADPSDKPDIAHPWSSGVADEPDDFAGPNAVYGPGTSEQDPHD